MIHAITDPNQTCLIMMLRNRYVSPSTTVKTTIDSNNPDSGMSLIASALKIRSTDSKQIPRAISDINVRLYLSLPRDNCKNPTTDPNAKTASTDRNNIFSISGNSNIL